LHGASGFVGPVYGSDIMPAMLHSSLSVVMKQKNHSPNNKINLVTWWIWISSH